MNETSFIKVSMFEVGDWCRAKLAEIAAHRRDRWHSAVATLNERRKRSFFRRPLFTYEEGRDYLKARGKCWPDYLYSEQERRIRVLFRMASMSADDYVYLSASDYDLLSRTYVDPN